jgi:hypothetical protein
MPKNGILEYGEYDRVEGYAQALLSASTLNNHKKDLSENLINRRKDGYR